MGNYSWYTPTSSDASSDTIHQTLAFGNMHDIKTLKKTVGEKRLEEMFLKHPKKVYSAPSLNFIAKFILHIGTFDEQKYLKTTPRNTR